MTKLIYKISAIELWDRSQKEGVFAGAAVDINDGFIHFSTADQLRATAMKHFSNQSELYLIAVNEEMLAPDLKYEVSRDGALFPHLYAPLPLDAVIWVKPLPLDGQGNHIFPELD